MFHREVAAEGVGSVQALVSHSHPQKVILLLRV